MTRGILTKYNASAGSGKTFKLTGIYLDYLFINQNSYRNILAVTFTNKAAAEMKERILGSLYRLASGMDNEYLDDLSLGTGKSIEQIRKDALTNLESILHDYSRFSVGTIDSFFQKILRSFARESGLQAGFNLVIDHSVILSEAVDDMLREADDDPQLLKWLTEYAYKEVQSGKNWNLKRKIEELGSEIFKENYRLLSEAGMIVGDREQLSGELTKLSESEALFRNRIKTIALNALSILDRYNVIEEELYKKSQGILKFFRDAVKGVPDKLSDSISKACSEQRYTSLKNMPPSVASAIADGLDSAVREMVEFYQSGIVTYRSGKLVLDNLYTLGLLNDIAAKVRAILNESNRFLLSDAGDVLRQIIGKDQAPFIYEKVGNRYSNYMIDEFQDTSRIQWDNFLPLIRDSLAEGEGNLVVGDIKQSIYRWRNSDWRIFRDIDGAFHRDLFSVEALKQNWRSCKNIIGFNNAVFSMVPGLIEDTLKLETGSLTALYTEVVQEDPGRSPGGYVRIKQVDATDLRHQDEVVLEQIPLLIEEIQDMGYSPSDIGILVRTNSEGQKVINSILTYASGVDPDHKERYSYQVISQDSLLLAYNPTVKFILSALRFMSDNDDRLAHASMVHYYCQITQKEGDADRPDLLTGGPDESGSTVLPPGYLQFLHGIRFLPLFEIIDRIIGFFRLAEESAGIPFITTLQDLVLELSGSEANDIPLFLEWWEKEGYRKSVSSPEQPGAIQLMTIHKSKGLEFSVVILPFLSWSFVHGRPPVIWVSSETDQFAKLGALPVSFKKEIADTLFAEYYEEERTHAAIDKLNLLYVAFTRARESIFGFVPVGRNNQHCGRMVMDAIGDGIPFGESGTREGRWDNSRRLFELGEMPVKEHSGDHQAQTGLDIPYSVEVNDSRLRLKLNSSNYLSDREPGANDRINWGLLMHELFESVITRDDIIPALDALLLKGRISRQQRDTLESKISGALKNEIVASWFEPGQEVRTESGILLRGGMIRRPDRVMISAKGVTIVDFKFGEEHNAYIKQLNEYRSILLSMGYPGVKAYIWYVETGRVTEIDNL